MSRSVLHSLWPTLIEAMDARFSYLTDRLPAGRIFRHDGTLSCLSGWASDTFNTVLGVPSCFEDVDAITALYRYHCWPASWWLPADASDSIRSWLSQNGWECVESDMAMVREMDGLPVMFQRPNFSVHEVTSKEDMRLFGSVLSMIFEREAPEEAAEVREVYSAMQPPEKSQRHWQLLIGFDRGTPVSTASLFIKDGIASIGDIATHPAYRRCGFGTAMFEAALQRIHDYGATWCVLFASEDGQSLYARQGFNAVGSIDTWNISEASCE